MYLAISHDDVALHQPEVTTDLYASYSERLSPDRLAAVLDEHDAGSFLADGAHIMVPVATLRRLAAGHVPETWDADFDDMLAKAGSRGWLSEDGSAVRVHLERER